MAAYELAAGYETLYAAAACLQLWMAHAGRPGVEPLWQDSGWLQVALRGLLGRLLPLLGLPAAGPAPDDDEVTDRFVERIAEAAENCCSVTPFGLRGALRRTTHAGPPARSSGDEA
jgi:hypothetical protein